MFLKRELEGYLEIDHRESPGFTPEQARRARLPGLAVGAGKRFQSPTRKCCGCERTIILNPDRQRARAYCRQCDSYMCEMCAGLVKITGLHRPFKQFIDDFVSAVANGKPVPVFNPAAPQGGIIRCT